MERVRSKLLKEVTLGGEGQPTPHKFEGGWRSWKISVDMEVALTFRA